MIALTWVNKALVKFVYLYTLTPVFPNRYAEPATSSNNTALTIPRNNHVPPLNKPGLIPLVVGHC